jgi:arginyl-tRNA synthetase
MITASGLSIPVLIKMYRTSKKGKEERLEIVKNEIRILEEKIDSLTNVFIIYINANGSSDKLKKQLNTILQHSKKRGGKNE